MATAPRRGWPAEYEEAASAAGWPSWSAWVERLEGDKGHSICGRMRAEEQDPCQLPEAWGHRSKGIMTGGCRKHAPSRPVGEANPGYIDGRTAQLGKGRLREAVDQRLNDPRWWETQEEVARLRAMLDLLVDAADGTDLVLLNDGFVRAYDGLVDAMMRGDEEGTRQALQETRRLRREAQGWRAAIQDMRRLTNTLSLVVSRDVRNRATAAEAVSRAQLGTYIELVGTLVEQEVLDRLAPHVPRDVMEEARRELAAGTRGILDATQARTLVFMGRNGKREG